MLAFKNDTALKDFYLKRVEAHQKADEIARGFYWREGRGCAIGCLAHVDNNAHATLEREANIPAGIAYLADRIFENLPDDQYKGWPARFTKAIKVGSDLSLITARFMYWLFSDELPGFFDHTKFPASLASVQEVAALYKRKLEGEKITTDEWQSVAKNARKARDAAAAAAAAADAYAAAADAYAADAYAAAAAAADADAAAAYAAAAYAAAAYAAAAYAAAAYADADAAAAAADAYAAAYAAYAADAAYAAAYAAAAYAAAAYAAAAHKKFYSKMADKLIALLESAE